MTLMLSACGQPQLLAPPGLPGKVYPTYGLFNQDQSRSDRVCYAISVGNVVWSIILIETIVAPIYFLGFSLFNPVGVNNGQGCGIDA
jgi:hypothetical protein